MMEQPEEYEHIPWSQLAAEQQAGRNRMWYIAAAVVVAVAVGTVAARALTSGGSGSVPSTVVDAAPVDDGDAEVAAEPMPSAPSPGPPAPAIYSEADLMAGVLGDNISWPGEHGAAAAARAEWFVTDYFTADLDPLGSLPVRTALPAGGPLPPLPQDGVAGGVTYVEWARATRLQQPGPDLYRVTVAFRSVGAVGDGAFFRMPVRAVEVVVAVTADGAGLSVVDLPAPADLPAEVGYPAWPDGDGEVPDGVTDAALEAAAAWGDAPEIVESGAAGAGFRVVVTVADEVGNRWPLSFWLDPAGALTLPPWVAATG